MKISRTIPLLALACLLVAPVVHAAPFLWLYTVPSGSDSTLIKVDLANDTVVDRIPLGHTLTVPDSSFPYTYNNIAASPNGRWVAAIASDGPTGTSPYILVDTNNSNVTPQALHPNNTHIHPPVDSLAWSADGKSLYALLETKQGPVHRIVTPDNPSPTDFLNLPGDTQTYYIGVVSGTDGTTLLAYGDTVARAPQLVNYKNGTARPVGKLPDGIVASVAAGRDGRWYLFQVFPSAYNRDEYHFDRLTPGTSKETDDVKTIDVPAKGFCANADIAVDAAHHQVYLSNGAEDGCTPDDTYLSVYDTDSFQKVGSITLPSPASALALAPDGKHLYVLLPASSKVAVVDTATNTVSKTFRITDEDGVAYPAYVLYGHGTLIGGTPGGTATALAVDPTNPQIVYAGTDGDGLFVSKDGGDTWQVVTSGGLDEDSRITALVAAPDDTGVYAGTRHNGVFKSTDHGATWVRKNKGLDNTQVRALTLSRENSSVIFAGTAGADSVYKSSNGGGQWSAIGKKLLRENP
jgi:YVTN family beta-propeller protein